MRTMEKARGRCSVEKELRLSRSSRVGKEGAVLTRNARVSDLILSVFVVLFVNKLVFKGVVWWESKRFWPEVRFVR